MHNLVLRLPDEWTRWSDIQKALHEMVREDLGLRVKDIVCLEGLMGVCDGEVEIEPESLLRIELAFAGSVEYWKAFDLWDYQGGKFVLVRGRTGS